MSIYISCHQRLHTQLCISKDAAEDPSPARRNGDTTRSFPLPDLQWIYSILKSLHALEERATKCRLSCSRERMIRQSSLISATLCYFLLVKTYIRCVQLGTVEENKRFVESSCKTRSHFNTLVGMYCLMFPLTLLFVNFMLTFETEGGSIPFYKTIKPYETLGQYRIFITLVI